LLPKEETAQRERARSLVERARALRPTLQLTRDRVQRLDAEARALARSLPSWASEERKVPLWELRDDARSARREEAVLTARQQELLRAARAEDPTFGVARSELAAVLRAAHERAEARGAEEEAARIEVALRGHDDGVHTAYLDGPARLTLHTEPVRAQVTITRLVEHRRRLVPGDFIDLGTTPLESVDLPVGSWVAELRAPGRLPVVLPIHLPRAAHWDATAPGGAHPVPAWLPTVRDLGPDDVYVPGGWALLGGDTEGHDDPPQRVWVDPYVIQRHPVSNADWAVFLADAAEVPADAEVPPDHAVVGITLASARAYAVWLSERTGHRWRLPWEAEWEKAARGTDGRPFVTGRFLDPTWANIRGGHESGALRAALSDDPKDTSVYGVRSTAGGVRDLCEDRWDGEGLRVVEGRPVREAAAADDASVVRGGCWKTGVASARVDRRGKLAGGDASDQVGMRLVRSLAQGRSVHSGLGWRLATPDG